MKKGVKPNFAEVTIQVTRVMDVGERKVTTSDDVADVLRKIFCTWKDEKERFVVLFLNSRNKITGFNVVSVGTLNASLVEPREVFRPAIVAGAAAIIVAHNHPSGDVDPSADDRKTTTVLTSAAKILHIPILDHIIIGDGNHEYYSFADNGILNS